MGFQGWLGHKYEKGATEFRLWSPLARRVQLLLFKKGSKKPKIIKMSRGTSVNKDRHEMNTHGVWSTTVKKDLDGVATSFVCIMRKVFIGYERPLQYCP